MLFNVVTKVGQAFVTTRNQYLGDAVQRVADFAEKRLFSACAAAMLAGVVQVRMDPALLCGPGAELEYLSGLVVDECDGVEQGHAQQLNADLADRLFAAPHKPPGDRLALSVPGAWTAVAPSSDRAK